MHVLKWFTCLMFIPISQILLIIWELAIVNFTGFWGFVVVKSSFSQMVSLIVILKNKGYPLKILLKRTTGLLNKPKFLFGISHSEYSEWFCIKSCKWGASCKPTWSLFSSAVLFCVFCLSCCVFLLFVISLCCYLLLASSMAESSRCLWNCSRNSVRRLVFSPAFTHCRELISQWESYDREITIVHATVWWSLNRCETGTVVHTAFEFFLFCFSVLCSLFCLSFFGILFGWSKKC